MSENQEVQAQSGFIASFDLDLATMLDNPEKMNQRNTNLCGIFSACKVIIERKPEAFKTYALQVASDFISNSNAQAKQWQQATQLTWSELIVFVALRKKLNYFLGYNPVSDKGFHGFTWPQDVQRLMKQFKIPVKTNLVCNEKKAIQKINAALMQEKSVIGLFDWRCFIRGKRSVNEWHYVQIISIREVEKNELEMRYWNPNGGCIETKVLNIKQLRKSMYFWWSCG